MRTAVLAGATGLTGGYCLNALLEDERYGTVTVLVRRPMTLAHPKLRQVVIDFDRLAEYAEHIRGDDLFCCLGTTIKKAGSPEAFSRVDLDYPKELARIASANGVSNFLVISALEAHSNSKILYGRVKGQMEEAVSQYDFEGLFIFRPSLLIGEREESRLAEGFGLKLYSFMPFLFSGPLKRIRPIVAEAVAGAMITVANASLSGQHVFLSRTIQKIFDSGQVTPGKTGKS